MDWGIHVNWTQKWKDKKKLKMKKVRDHTPFANKVLADLFHHVDNLWLKIVLGKDLHDDKIVLYEFTR